MRSLTFKLTLAFLVVSLTGVALVAVLVWGINSVEFNRFVTDRGLNEYTLAVTNYYQTRGNWTGVADALRQQGIFSNQAQGSGQAGSRGDITSRGDNSIPPMPFVLVDASGRVVIDTGPFHAGDLLPAKEFQRKATISMNNQVVGYVVGTGGPQRPNPLETRYLARTNEALLLAALGAVIIAVMLGLFLARTITRPIRELTMASSAMAAGNFNQRVRVRSKDELGELTQTFNQMSADLEHANQLRRQMTADIAHDLRTPLSVITGYLEGLKDGVVKPSPKRFTAMYDEAIFLQRLVEDLRTLSLADAGELSINRQWTQPAEIVSRLAASFQHQAEQNRIQLSTTVADDLPPVNLDPERIQQALVNLVSNALRYTPAGGEILLSARQEDGQVRIEVSDTGSGIASETLPYIFDRFYRVDDSRQEAGSGLGLAIAKSIVELQGGKLSAASAGEGQGSQFTIQVPC